MRMEFYSMILEFYSTSHEETWTGRVEFYMKRETWTYEFIDEIVDTEKDRDILSTH